MSRIHILFIIVDLILSVISLLVGGLLYLGFRSEKLLMFEWGNCMHLNEYIDCWRNICSSYSPSEWVIYALPDGLWLFSYMLLVHLIWINTNDKKYKIWLYILPLVGISSEVLQLCIEDLGTFDLMDLICYVGAIILFNIKTKLQWKQKEV